MVRLDYTSKERQALHRQRLKASGYKLYAVNLEPELAAKFDLIISAKIALGMRKQKAIHAVVKDWLSNIEASASASSITPLVFDQKAAHAIATNYKQLGKSASQIAVLLTTDGFCNRKGEPYTKDQVSYLLKQDILL